MKVGPKSSLRPFLHRPLQLFNFSFNMLVVLKKIAEMKYLEASLGELLTIWIKMLVDAHFI